MLPLNFSPELSPLFAITPVYDWADGIFSPLDRALLNAKNEPQNKSQHVDLTFFYAPSFGNIEEKKNLTQEIYAYLNFKEQKAGNKISVPQKYNLHFETNDKQILPAMYFKQFGKKLDEDIKNFIHPFFIKNFFHPPTTKKIYSSQNTNSAIAKNSDVWLHHQSQVSHNCEFDTSKGAIVIDQGAQVSAFSLLRGPLYIGKHAIIDRAMLTNMRVGDFCRIGGEVSDSLIAALSNKHHEGFVGHSLIGSWVNLGALTTTSDLKNNYGYIRLQYKDKIYDTQEIKFGSIVGDFVKTAIGTMLGTGTVVDVGALLFEDHPRQKYYAPFFWGGREVTCYHWERFIADAQKIMQRRMQSLSDYEEERLHKLYF